MVATMEQQPIIAVSAAEWKQFGCPYCGYRSGYPRMSCGGATLVECGSPECNKGCLVLAEDITESPVGINNIYPQLQDHPRRGIPSHGQPDTRPEGGGEFFRSRGMGLDNCSCFVCGTHDRDGKGHYMLNNIAAFVRCKEAGERVVAMFARGARLDYREHEPDYVQVKVGACDAHQPNLILLNALTRDGIITVERIRRAAQFKRKRRSRTA
ncbi:MAG: hypothetical protein HYT31_01070 [Parcubacteria group bacterium]|nr:hypothetical protein [Parcubacteria group bacterium]